MHEFVLMVSYSYLFIFSIISADETALKSAFGVTKWLNEIQDKGYDKLIPPGALDGNTTDVRVRVYVESIGNFRSTSMDYEMDIFFIEHWTDKRLMHNHTNNFIIFSDIDQLHKLWTPDVYFANSKTALYNYVMVPNMNFRIWSDGRVRLGIRVAMKVLCHMDLTAYPIDQQICTLKILTCATAQDMVNVTWSDTSPVSLNDEIIPVDLEVTKSEALTCEAIYYGFSYSCLLVKFHLHRNIQYSLLQTYLPTSFIVMISWISFWLDPASVPGRVGLALTTLLTLSTQAVAIAIQLPPVGYAKAQDVWFGICILFLSGSLVEFAVVHMYTRLEQQNNGGLRVKEDTLSSVPLLRKTHSSNDPLKLIDHNGSCLLQIDVRDDAKDNMENDLNDDLAIAIGSRNEETYLSLKKANKYRRRAQLIDQFSRIAFPVAFVVLCVAYWFHYLAPRFHRSE